MRFYGPSKVADTYAFLDDGATITAIERRFARELGIRGPKININIKGINDREAVNSVSEKVCFELSGTFEKHTVANAIIVENWRFPTQTVSKDLVRDIAKSASVFIQPLLNAQPKILLGQDNWRLLASNETREIDETGLAISRTTLGWVVHGQATSAPLKSRFYTLTGSVKDAEFTVEERLDVLMKRYFAIEDFGIREKSELNATNTKALTILKKTSRRVGHAWETGLLWKDKNQPLADSRGTALRRLFSLEKKLDRNPDFATLYYREMQRLIDNGYAVKSDDEESRTRIWYLPHFGVTSASKPGKIRLVKGKLLAAHET